MLIGLIFFIVIQVLYTSYFIVKSLFLDAIQILLIALIGYMGSNCIILRGNRHKGKYIKRGLLITGATTTVGILVIAI